MKSFKSIINLKTQQSSSEKKPKNEVGGEASYAMGRKMFSKKTYESILSENLAINNSDKKNPKPRNYSSAGMRTQMLKFNTIGRGSIEIKNTQSIIKEILNSESDSTNITIDTAPGDEVIDVAIDPGTSPPPPGVPDPFTISAA